jgi:hypothetical protein
MLPLATIQAPIFDIPHLLRVPTPEHLVHETVIVALIIARIDAFKPVPVLDKDLLEDVPVPRGFCNHQGAPSWGVRMCAVQLFYHTLAAQSTSSSACTGGGSPTSLPFEPRGLQGS